MADTNRSAPKTNLEDIRKELLDKRAKSAGPGPTPAPSRDAALESLAKSLYGISDTRPDTVNPFLQAFSERYPIRSILSNALASVSNSQPDLQPLHFEILLDQAQELIGRALQDNQRYVDLSEKAFRLYLELSEFRLLDGLHERERQAGAYLVPYLVAKSEHLGLQKALETNTKATRLLETLAANEWDGRKYKVSMQTEYATASAKPNTDAENRGSDLQYNLVVRYMLPLKTFRDRANYPESPRDEFPPGSMVVGGETEIPANRVSINRKRSDAVGDIANYLSKQEADARSDSVIAQWLTSVATLEAAVGRLEASETTAEWLHKNRDFQEENLTIARRLNDEKKEAATLEAGALNFIARMSDEAERYQLNVKRALERLIAAKDGLNAVFGYAMNLETDSITTLWKSIQEAIDFVSRGARIDQNMVKQISLKSKAANIRTEGTKRIWAFTLGRQDFDALRSVRLQGAAVHVVGANTAGAWSGSLTAPADTEYDWPVSGGTKYKNGRLKTLQFGRALEWHPLKSPDVFGLVSLHNASPFGNWELALNNLSTLGIATSEVQDVLIDFHVAGRA